jgi:hypothetical protein
LTNNGQNPELLDLLWYTLNERELLWEIVSSFVFIIKRRLC